MKKRNVHPKHLPPFQGGRFPVRKAEYHRSTTIYLAAVFLDQSTGRRANARTCNLGLTARRLPAKEDEFLNILAHLDQLFALAFKNAVHHAFNLCHYRHRLCYWSTPPPFLDLRFRWWYWLWLLLLSSGHKPKSLPISRDIASKVAS
jgi:hypothetical protein